MKRNLLLTLILIFVFSLSACHGEHTEPDRPLVRVVTRISISKDEETRIYSSDESLRAILAYLRILSPTSSTESTPTQGSIYRISLIYSDGSLQEFYQRGTFFQGGDGTWRSITEHDALNLSKLFNLLEPEPIPSAI